MNHLKKITKQYPFEMYCKVCDTTIAYCRKMGKVGEIIMASDMLNLDFTKPLAGDPIPQCECHEKGVKHLYWTRPTSL